MTLSVAQLLVNQLAKDLALRLNQLDWPEAHGPYQPDTQHPHKICGSKFTITVNNNVAMFTYKDATNIAKFIDIPQNDDVNVVNFLAVEFLGWITQ